MDAYSRDDQTKMATGSLTTIDNQIDTTTGTGKLKAVFDNRDRSLWPNQFVNIHLLLEVKKNNTVVPSAAIQRGPQGTYVFVVKPDNDCGDAYCHGIDQPGKFDCDYARHPARRKRGDRRTRQAPARHEG